MPRCAQTGDQGDFFPSKQPLHGELEVSELEALSLLPWSLGE
jgi:hypothetical protein